MSEDKCPECGTTGRVMPNGRLHVGGGIYHSKTACVAELQSQLAAVTAERDAAVRERDVARRALEILAYDRYCRGNGFRGSTNERNRKAKKLMDDATHQAVMQVTKVKGIKAALAEAEEANHANV